MENLVFTELVKRGIKPNVELFYYNTRNRREVDFVIKEGTRVNLLLQVTYELSSPETLNREIKSLVEASEELNAENLVILTWDEEKEETTGGKSIRFIPLWKWLVEAKTFK